MSQNAILRSRFSRHRPPSQVCGASVVSLGMATILVLLLFTFTLTPAHAQGPTGGTTTGTCWQCHRQPNIESTNGIAAANALCQDCHAKADTIRRVDGKEISLQIRESDFGKTRHALIACVSCHASVSRSPHRETSAMACDSSACHQTLAKHLIIAGEPHLNVDCEACHFEFDAVLHDSATDRVAIARVDSAGRQIVRTNHWLASPVPCERCHALGNRVNAAAMTLPPKDITCIGCHPSAPIVGGPVSYGAVIVFLIGLVFSASVWLRGSVGGRVGLSLGEKLSFITARAVAIVFSRRFLALLRAAFVDGILHWRILKESVARWVAHSLILLPFLARFLLAIITGIAVQFFADAPLTRVLLDRDAPPIAFANDFLAVLIIIGAGYAGYLRATDKQRRELTTGQDTLALVLLGLIFIVGFVLEGMHILVARLPWERAWFAFGGAAIAAPLSFLPLDWSAIYPFVFYGHAILVGIFIAYLPFSKFFHILTSLFFLAIRPVLEQE